MQSLSFSGAEPVELGEHDAMVQSIRALSVPGQLGHIPLKDLLGLRPSSLHHQQAHPDIPSGPLGGYIFRQKLTYLLFSLLAPSTASQGHGKQVHALNRVQNI